jgi:ribosomal protein L40E
MAFTECRYCEHRNPPDANYCNACGATLTLAPCPRCGAVVEVTATSCYQCQGSIQQSKELVLSPSDQARARTERDLKDDSRIDELENVLVLKKVDDKGDLSDPKDLTKPAEVTPAKAHPGRKRVSLAALATAVFAISAVIGYQVYRHHSLVIAPPASKESIQAQGHSNPVEQTSTPEPAGRGSAIEQASTPEPVSVPTIPVGANQASEVSPCTEGILALGLCTPQ